MARPTVESERIALSAEREELILRALDGQPRRHWFRPMQLGGRDASWHSPTLARLVRKGFVEWRFRGGSKDPWQTRGSKEYRLTECGRTAARAATIAAAERAVAEEG